MGPLVATPARKRTAQLVALERESDCTESERSQAEVIRHSSTAVLFKTLSQHKQCSCVGSVGIFRLSQAAQNSLKSLSVESGHGVSCCGQGAKVLGSQLCLENNV